MSLVKKLTMTENKLAANRSNGGQSQGPVTEEGMEICATARRRHGLYAQAQETALLGLGEDPADFEELLDGVREEFTPAAPCRKGWLTVWHGCFGSGALRPFARGRGSAPRPDRGNWTRQPLARENDAAEDDGGNPALLWPARWGVGITSPPVTTWRS